MFAKMLLKSFAYDMVRSFPTEEVKMVYDKYDIIKCYIYFNLIDKGSCVFSISSAKKNVISNIKCSEKIASY